MDRVVRHLTKYNKIGGMHYALKDDGANMEMYARKVALLQVLKYMPKSIEVVRAMEVANAVDSGKNFTFDGEVVVVDDDAEEGARTASSEQKTDKAGKESTKTLPTCSDKDFDARKADWRQTILDKEKTPSQLISMIQTRMLLTENQKLIIDSFAHEND